MRSCTEGLLKSFLQYLLCSFLKLSADIHDNLRHIKNQLNALMFKAIQHALPVANLRRCRARIFLPYKDNGIESVSIDFMAI